MLTNSLGFYLYLRQIFGIRLKSPKILSQISRFGIDENPAKNKRKKRY